MFLINIPINTTKISQYFIQRYYAWEGDVSRAELGSGRSIRNRG